LLAVNLAGGTTGAVLLLITSQHTFDTVIPWLLQAASLTFTFAPHIAPRLKRMVTIGPATLLVLHFILAIYGGYFGGAVGIASMALWSLLGHTDIHEMNAAKTLVVGTMNSAAVVCFIVAGKVSWPETMTMMAAAIAGGCLGARLARRMNPKHIRAGVIVINFTVTALFFMKI
jgi:uncharacterized membrane protein YfcA